YDERNAAIVLTCAGERTTFTVSQKQKDALLLTSDKVELDATGGDFTLALQANVPVSYEIEPGADWLKPADASTKALEDLSFAFHAEENTDTEARQATITLSGNGLTETVTVYQAGTAPVLVLGQQEYIVGSTGETLTVELQSNTDYRVQLPAVDWLTEADTRSLSAYTHYFTVAPNDTYDARTAEIIFATADGTLADTVRVTQVQQDAILLAQQEYDIPAEGGTLDFTVQTNVDVTATPAVDWITQAPGTRGLVEKNLCFDIAPNEGTEARQGTITLSGGGVTQVITVRQEAYEEPELVRVEYRTGYTWEEAHDNLPLLYYATVYRDRYYSNGEVITDTFVDAGHPVETNIGLIDGLTNGNIPIEEVEGERKFSDGSSVYYHKGATEGGNMDGFKILTSTVEVDNLNRIMIVEDYTVAENPGDWDSYVVSKLYQDGEYLFISPEADLEGGQYELTDLQSGWYFQGFADKLDESKICYQNQYFPLYMVRVFLRFYDQYLVIDERRINFSEYWPQRKFNQRIEDLPATSEFGPGKKITREASSEFLGRDVYAACIMNIYEKKIDPNTNKLYYIGDPKNGNKVQTWFYSNGISGDALPYDAPLTVIVNRQPILSTDSDWIIIDGIEQGARVDGEGPVQLDVYEWTIKWSVLPNKSGGDRTGYIYMKDEQGNVRGEVHIHQIEDFD
ncbi:MAG TPA: BACON domain-containing protein, partial [Candidatus Bacteroides pullicola]|nr:BACON domain-containing protein [Candidatus Bacteroides pullicola]